MKPLYISLLRLCAVAALLFAAADGVWAKSDLEAEPEHTNFGTVEPGTVTRATITVTNETGYFVSLRGTEFENDPFGEFTVVSALPPYVTGNGSFQITIEFRPVVAGAKDAELKILHRTDYEESAHFYADVQAPVQPELVVYPSDVDFGQVVLSSGAGRQVSIRNTGTTTASVELAVSDDPAGEFAITTATTLTLQPDEARLVGLAFTPSTTGMRSAVLTVGMPAPYTTTMSVSLTGEGMPRMPKLTVSPGYVDFGEVQISTNAVRQVLVSNDGTADAVVSFAIGSDPGGEFAVLSTTAIVLPAGGSTYVDLVFFPSTTGVRTADLIVSMPAPWSGTTIIPLNGTGIDNRRPELTVYPYTLNFGDVLLSSSAVRQVQVSNTGDRLAYVTLEFLDNPDGEFTVTSATFELPPGGSHSVGVSFLPMQTGAHTARLLITMPPPFADTHTVNLYGTGVGMPVISVSPNTLDFGNIATTSNIQVRTLTIRNTGTADASLQIDFPDGFEPGISVPPAIGYGTEVPIPVSFRPQQEGDYNETALVRTDAGDIVVVLTGAYHQPPPPPQSATVSIPEITANVGQQFVLPFRLDAITPGLAYNVASCRVTFRFNTTLMTPAAATISADSTTGGFRTLTVAAPVANPAQGGVLLSLPVIAALGDAEATVIELLDVQWLNAAGDVLAVQTQYNNGRLIIGDIWRQGGIRLVNPNSGDLHLSVSPNPSHGNVTFRMLYRTAATLDLYDVMGNRVMSFTQRLPAPGTEAVSMDADVSSLPLGTYYCRLSTGKFSLVRTLRIE